MDTIGWRRSGGDLRPEEQATTRLRAGLAGRRRHEWNVDLHDGADGGAVGLVGEQERADLAGGGECCQVIDMEAI